MRKICALLTIAFLLCQCGNGDGFATYVPDPASKVTRTQALASAYAYTQVRWKPSTKNILHGSDADGIFVQTPDLSLQNPGPGRGYWSPDQEQISMPYQWGGFDTPSSFLGKIRDGYAAGDVATQAKKQAGDAAVSKHAAGVDCSGFVSRCWRLSRPVSTAEMPTITTPISWDDLKSGDILLTKGHVILFDRWLTHGSNLVAYEAGPLPAWKVSCNHFSVKKLLQRGYAPRRYLYIIEPSS